MASSGAGDDAREVARSGAGGDCVGGNEALGRSSECADARTWLETPGMVDNLSREQRQKNMRAIRSRDTAPELEVRRQLHRLGFRFRTHDSKLPGTPDIILPRYKTAIFVHGCFWHGHWCTRGVTPKTRPTYWVPKLATTQKRDAGRVALLRTLGWKVITIWECEIMAGSIRSRFRPLLNARLRYSRS